MDLPEIAGDPRFFAQAGPFRAADLAAAVGGRLATAGAADGPVDGVTLGGVAPLQLAGPRHASFLDNPKYRSALAATRAGAVLVRAALVATVPAGTAAIVVADPYAAWARVAGMFHPEPPAAPGIHPAAVVDPGARVDPSAAIGPCATVAFGAEIGPGCEIGPGAAIGPGVVLGAACRIGAHASLSHALLGDRVVVFPGVRIGQEGFGFAPTAAGFVAVPQLGRVVIGHDVWIGANTTIDRGSLRDTVIGAGSRLDNLVQVAHNVRVGRLCVLVAQVGISGSVELEDHVMLGGQAGIAGHLRVGHGARVAAQSGVMADVPAGAEMAGSPAQPAMEAFRQIVMLRRMARNGRPKSSPTGGDAA